MTMMPMMMMPASLMSTPSAPMTTCRLLTLALICPTLMPGPMCLRCTSAACQLRRLGGPGLRGRAARDAQATAAILRQYVAHPGPGQDAARAEADAANAKLAEAKAAQLAALMLGLWHRRPTCEAFAAAHLGRQQGAPAGCLGRACPRSLRTSPLLGLGLRRILPRRWRPGLRPRLPLAPLRPPLLPPTSRWLGLAVVLPAAGPPWVARAALPARWMPAGTSSGRCAPSRARTPMRQGRVLPPRAPGVATPRTLPAPTCEGRPGRAPLLPARGLPWWPAWWQPQGLRLPPTARLGHPGHATPAAPSSGASRWLRGCKRPAVV